MQLPFVSVGTEQAVLQNLPGRLCSLSALQMYTQVLQLQLMIVGQGELGAAAKVHQSRKVQE